MSSYPSLRLLRSTSTWIAAVILALLPILVAADFGGVLWWTQYVAGVAILIAVVLAIPGVFAAENSGLLRQHLLLAPIFLWIAYAWFQTLPMKPSFVETLSVGSHAAYTEWIEPFLARDGLPSHFPISIAPEQSRHAASVLMLLAGLVWASSTVFHSRWRIGMLLSVVAAGVAAISTFGLLRLVYPDILVFGTEVPSTAFGPFVNRNNAALMLNLGLATSLGGLLAWRLAALTGREVDDPEFEFNDLFALVSDRESLIGVVSAALCGAGLLVCGSRGGLVAGLVGMLLALGWVRQRRGFKSILVVGATVSVCVALLVIPLSLDLKSIQRLEVFSNDDFSTVLRDGRLDHWHDGWQAAVAHLPAGSGLGTYAYAYLPHQELSSASWYHHADNLWLELFVEQGVFGIAFALSLLVIWILALQKIDTSADPIDQGLRVAGWYMIGAIMLSQLFDFGLILPANLFLVAIFVSVIIARGVVAGTGAVVGSSGRSIVFRSPRRTLRCCGVGAVAIVTTIVGVRHLNTDAQVETIARSTSATLNAVSGDKEALAELASNIQDSPRSATSPALLDALSQVQYRQARLAQTLAAKPKNAVEALAAYRETGPMTRRLKWRSAQQPGGELSLDAMTTGSSSNEIDGFYRQALLASEYSLRRLPLGMESRPWQVYLDFIHRDEQRSQIAIEQMLQIYRRNPKMLVRLGTFAADSGASDLAAQLWRTALEIAPSVTVQVVQLVGARKDIALEDALPSDPIVYRQAAAHLIQNGQIQATLLERAAKEIACDRCQTQTEKANCLQLGGDIAFAMQQYDEAFTQYAEAIKMRPDDAPLHLKYIRRLREQDRRREALQAAREARFMIPEHPAFTKIIEEMAAADLKELEPGK